MKKLLISLILLMPLVGCYDEHYWDADYIFEKYCSMQTDRITCSEVSYSTCIDNMRNALDRRVEQYPDCSEEISQAYITKYRNMAEEDSCLDWNFKSENEYADEKLNDKATECVRKLYNNPYYIF